MELVVSAVVNERRNISHFPMLREYSLSHVERVIGCSLRV